MRHDDRSRLAIDALSRIRKSIVGTQIAIVPRSSSKRHRETRSGRSGRNDASVSSARSHEADAGWTKLFQARSLTLSKLRCASDAASVMST